MTLPQHYFDGLYEAADDPWSMTSRWYEQRKYALTVAALDRRRYSRALEAGCSVGVLTAALAPRCDELVAVDASARAVEIAREHVARTAPESQVDLSCAVLPDQWPEGTFDLVVLSEILYYFAPEDCDQLLQTAVESLRPGGALVAVHWRHPVEDYPQSGDEVHRRVDALPVLAPLAEHREADFLLGTWLLDDRRSVAQREGLL